jgi:hypothetical protein
MTDILTTLSARETGSYGDWQGVAPALWGTPSQPAPCSGPCIPDHTDTHCIAFTMWCTDVFRCCNPNGFGINYQSRTPYPCGVCFGLF